jgi:hypothetical protein
MKSIKERAQALLTLVETLVETPGLTWEAASNAVFAPGAPFSRLFRTESERVAFDKTREGRRIDQLIFGLPRAPVRPAPKEKYDPTRIVEIIQISPGRKRGTTRTRKISNRKPSNNGVSRRKPARVEGKKPRRRDESIVRPAHGAP